MTTNPPHGPQKPWVVQPGTTPRPHPPRRPQGPVDIRATKEYKTAARRWLSTIVGLPIALYTSYILYERLYKNKKPKTLGAPPRDQSSSSSSASPSQS